MSLIFVDIPVEVTFFVEYLWIFVDIPVEVTFFVELLFCYPIHISIQLENINQ